MALTGYSSKCDLEIQSSVVPAVATDLPVVIIGLNLPSEIFGVSGGCKDDGSDIRFTTDSAGVNELPRDIVYIDKTTSTCQIYVKIPSISDTVNTQFYVFWNNPNAEEPSGDSESGATSVWSDYYGVFHYADINNEWKGIKDSSTKWANQTPNGTISTVTGHVSGATAVEISDTFGIDLHENFSFKDLTNDLMFWCNLNGTSPVNNTAVGTNGVPFGWQGAGQFGLGWGQAITTSNAVPLTGWHHVWMRNIGGICRCYVDGVDKTQGTATASATEFDTWGYLQETSEWFCSEMRMTREVNNSIDNVLTMVQNESTPATFIVSGTVEVVASSTSITITAVDGDLNPIESASVFIDEDFAEPYIFNGITDVAGEASLNYTGANVSATLRVRKYGYKAFKTPLEIQGNDINQTVTMIADPQQT